jgi:RND superfamily putative drug exporter
MIRFDQFVRRHRRAVLALWLVALVAAVPFAMRQSDNLTGGGYAVPGSQSEAVRAEVERNFTRDARATLAAVVVQDGRATTAEIRGAIGALERAAADEPLVALPAAARDRALRRAGSGETLVVPLAVAVDDQDAIDVAVGLRERLGLGDDAATAGAVRTHLVGQGALWARMQEIAKHDVKSAEKTGFPIVALILLAVFGSAAAAALPLALGFASVLLTGGLIHALSTAMDMSVFVTNMASMIGIGVAVDYSLFVLARYREEIVAGKAPEAARSTAMATSGVAVIFSGVTVIASLAGLFLIDTTAIRSMAIGAILVVAVAILASATLLPALISTLGHRAWSRGRLFRRLRHRTRTGNGFWGRWTGAVMRRPVIALVSATAILLALASPALDLQTTNGALRQFDPQDETRQGFEAAAAVTGPGASAPVRVVAETGDKAAIAAIRRTIASDREVARVSAPVMGEDGRSALLTAQLEHDGESGAAKAAVARLRDALAAAPVGVAVGGTTAGQEDFRSTVSDSMWKIVLFVLGLSFVLLLVLLRSVVLPLKAVVMNLLSVGAAYGVLTLAFGEIDAVTPPLILAIVFGLSMDYEVFLLSRIRERYDATGDTREAVAEGLASSARTISSAALIMVAVFMIFVGTGLPSIQQIGLGAAVAIAVDATIVRLALVPAAMQLLGGWNWWLPRPLARIIPAVNFEAGVEIAPDPRLAPPKPRRHSPARRLLRHYGEMVLAMVVGMVALGGPLGMLLGDGQILMLLNMGFSMTVPMVAWMRYRGHGWKASGEMAASMILPTLAALVVFGSGLVDDFDAVLIGEHVVMLAAMLGVMLLRPAEYLHHHGAHAA